MSFYRVGQNRRKKHSVPKRPGWDDSVNDLTVFRATPEEVFLRKEAHKSKNHISVKLEKLRKERQRNKLSGAEAQQLAIMKEVLYDQHELQKVLAKSDTMMAVVKDLFGDDPKRFMGFPNVTSAPQADADSNKSGSLVASVPDIYTRTEKLSNSVMSQSALNDVQSDTDSESGSEGEIDQPQPISYQSKLNLQRFQDYLQEEEKLSAHMDPPSLVSQLNKKEERKREKNAHRAPETSVEMNGASAVPASSSVVADKERGQMMQLLASLLSQGQPEEANSNDSQMLNALMNAAAAKKREESGYKTPPNARHCPNLPSERTPPSAINDTKKVKKTKKCAKPSESHSSSMNSSANMSNMRQVLQELENEVAAYELQTGRRPQEESNKTETFSGYTIALVSAVSKLTKYLKETDLRVRTEVTLREQLTQDVYQLRTIIDALATDIILTQEEYGKLYSEHQRYKDNTTAALASINNQMLDLRRMVVGKYPENDSRQQQETSVQPSHEKEQQQKQQQQQQHQPLNTTDSTTKCDTSMTSTPIYIQQDSSTQSGSSSYRPLPGQVLPTNSIAAATSLVSASAAVMLSPPVRKTRVHTNNADLQAADYSKVTQRQTSLMDIADLSKQDQNRPTDPPHLTQTPPITNTINVPRPIPLVQTNVSISLPGDQLTAQHKSNTSSHGARGIVNGFTRGSESATSSQITPRDQKLPVMGGLARQAGAGPDLTDLVKLGDETEEQLHRLQELAVEEAMNNPALQELMQSQIAELNRQQEEARQRLLDLLDKQKMQQSRIQQHFQDPQAGDASSSSLSEQKQAFRQQDHRSLISPPISPISQKREQDVQSLQSRGIIVSLPMVDLDVSGGSFGSPRGPSQTVK
ncbi:hypothetical protein EGW08_006625 [Elysia chlorotica]|uniref:Spindle and centriole-associated protein 1 n=1 Tax=Elysia chlorotica TaxID=188477 RepID=A0A3S0ZSA3_ELYCH|nr:hypothetical protein EGW08_006625 [Elysia chlorotica]